ncbi:flippase [Immundisolibacter sp.]|uniref:flippase n=1 Tax=Immundisolibacter sp. TaxID=1934948 RepID=UPI003563090F
MSAVEPTEPVTPPGAGWLSRQSPALRRVALNMGWLGLEQVVRMATGLVVGIYVARHLGPAGYGVIGYATALMLIGSALSRMGLQEVATRDLVRDEPGRNLTLGSAFALRLAGGVLAYGVLLLFGLNAAADPQTRLAVLVIGAGVLAQPFDMASAWFQAHQRLAPLALARLTGVLGCAALRIGFVLTDKPLLWFAWPVAAEIALGAGLIMGLYARAGGSPLAWRVKGARLRALLGAALPLTLAIGTTELSLRLPQVLLMQLGSVAQVGYYAAATRLSEALYMLPVMACTALFPMVVRAHDHGPETYARRMEAFYGFMFWGGVAVALPLSLLAPWLIRLLFGPDYVAAIDVLRIHAWSLPLVALGVARSRTLIAEDLPRFNLLAAGVNLVANALLAWWLIPPLGATGAAWASVLPRLVSVVAINFLFARTRRQGVVMVRGLWAPGVLFGYLRARRAT